MRKRKKTARRRRKKLSILDLAGSAREAFREIYVDKWLQKLRDEWDRKLD